MGSQYSSNATSRNDATYRALQQKADNLREIQKQTAAYQKAVDNAYSKIKWARNVEMADVVLPGVSVYSWLETHGANKAVQKAKEEYQKFNNTVQNNSELAGYAKSLSTSVEKTSQKWDIISDTIGLPDLTSILIMEKQGDAKAKLEELSSKLSDFKKKVDSEYQNAESELSAYENKAAT
jgi:hypothetical protein